MYYIYQCSKFTLSFYKMNPVLKPTSILSHKIQNTVDSVSLRNSRHQKWVDNVEKFVFIYRHNDPCIDNEETAVWLLTGSLV